MQVDTGLRALRQRSQQHFNASVSTNSGSPSSSALLLFYAVECAMKAALLRRMSARSTADLKEEHKTHNLGRLAKELRLPPGSEPKANYRLRSSGSRQETVDVSRLHEAWRYGSDLTEDDMKEAEALLTKLYELATQDSKK